MNDSAECSCFVGGFMGDVVRFPSRVVLQDHAVPCGGVFKAAMTD